MKIFIPLFNKNNKTFYIFSIFLIVLITSTVEKQMRTATTAFQNLSSQFKLSPQPDTVGFTLGKIESKTLLRKHAKSKLYELNVNEMSDGRPYKLLELIGSHYEVGYDYGTLIGQETVEAYDIFLRSAGMIGWKRSLLELFMDWQYDSYVSQQIPNCFKQEMRGIQNAGVNEHGIQSLRVIIQRTLVLSSYPGEIGVDITLALLDQFLRDTVHIKNQHILNWVENNMMQAARLIKAFMKKMKVNCSFFATWGTRTKGGKLYTMRNLDWSANTGLNANKMIFVWKVNNEIPHSTIGFPSMIGALTGMSSAGLTVHQAGLDSYRQTELGFQWTLRLRYIMMKAHTLSQAKQIWLATNNTLGMNHMVASASDLATGEPAFVVQTMRNYTAWFKDNDQRENHTQFVDPKTGNKFTSGYAMKDAVFRTNHAYDPFIRKFLTEQTSQHGSTMTRYNVIKDTFIKYESADKKIGQMQALNITANVAHKGGKNLYECPEMGQDNGTNIISVMFIPAQVKMYLAFEYGEKDHYLTACCAVYVEMDMKQWFS